jgi:hypothetical protein
MCCLPASRMPGAARFTSFFWTLTRAEEDPGWAAVHPLLAISGGPLRLDLHHSVLAECIMPEGTPFPASNKKFERHSRTTTCRPRRDSGGNKTGSPALRLRLRPPQSARTRRGLGTPACWAIIAPPCGLTVNRDSRSSELAVPLCGTGSCAVRGLMRPRNLKSTGTTTCRP